MQPESFGQFAAGLCIAELDVAVKYGLPMIADPVVDQMTMGTGLVEVRTKRYCVSVMPIFCMYSRAIRIIRSSVSFGTSYGENDREICPTFCCRRGLRRA